MERMVGQLQGQLEGVLNSLNRIERDLDANTNATRDLADTVATLKTEAKIGWKLLAGIAAATSFGGASVKHLLERIL